MGKTKTASEHQETISADELEALSSLTQEDSDFSTLNTSLAEIKKLEGIVGYILRNETSAVINLNKPDKLTDYALFSAQALDSSIEIAKQQELGKIESVLVEGKDLKALCMAVGENKINIFMEKNATQASIIKTMLL